MGCPFIQPEVGITSAPVIDVETGTLYVLARTKEEAGIFRDRDVQRLHALAVTPEREKLGGPIEIKASVQGRGDGSSSGLLAFDPLRENPRSSRRLVNGHVQLAWASSCDIGPDHGWVMAYKAHTLAQVAAFNTSPDGDDRGFWASDAGPAADKAGTVFPLQEMAGLMPLGVDGTMARAWSSLASKDWNRHVYFLFTSAVPKDFALVQGPLSTEPVRSRRRFIDPGATPTVSANSSKNGIVWALTSKHWDNPDGPPAILYAFDATNIAREPYNSDQESRRARADIGLRFNPPTVANGHVYVGAKGELDVDGLTSR